MSTKELIRFPLAVLTLEQHTHVWLRCLLNEHSGASPGNVHKPAGSIGWDSGRVQRVQ